MKKWRQIMIDYLSFSIKERWAVLVLVIIIGVIFMAPRLVQIPRTALIMEDSLLKKTLEGLDTGSTYTGTRSHIPPSIKRSSNSNAVKFYFDPNTIDIGQWVSLGVREKTAQTIQKYRLSGGQFKTPDDLGKIYGLSPEMVAQLKPFVRIEKKTHANPDKSNYPFSRPLPAPIMINKSDSIAWESLPGIGPTLAGRIVNFRTRLGGFYAVSQVGEVYGLQDSVFQKLVPYLKPDEQPVQLLDLNTVSQEELANHPYIRKHIANAIVQYRTTHGRFHQIEDLNRIHLIGPEQFQRISRYCKIE